MSLKTTTHTGLQTLIQITHSYLELLRSAVAPQCVAVPEIKENCIHKLILCVKQREKKYIYIFTQDYQMQNQLGCFKMKPEAERQQNSWIAHS